MANFCNTLFMSWAIIVLAGIALSGNNMVSGQCQGDVEGLIKQCSKYVQKSGPKMVPSQECCGVIETVDLPCVCKHITNEVEQIISMEKAAYISQFCGKPLAHGTKCGSYTVP